MQGSWLLHRARRELRRHRGATALLAAGFCLSTLLLGAWRLAAGVADRAAPKLREGVAVIAYLREDVGSTRAKTMLETLRHLPGVRDARLVTSDEAALRLRAKLGDEASLLDGLEPGFVPASIEVDLTATPGVETRAQEIGRRLGRLDAVSDVDDMGTAPARLASWLALAASVGRLALGLAILAALITIALAIRAGRGDRTIEAEVLAFLGETPLRARLPAALAGASSALGGAVGGALLLYVVFLVLRGGAGAVLTPLVGSGPGFVPGHELLAGLGAAVVLGWLAGLLAARSPRLADV